MTRQDHCRNVWSRLAGEDTTADEYDVGGCTMQGPVQRLSRSRLALGKVQKIFVEVEPQTTINCLTRLIKFYIFCVKNSYQKVTELLNTPRQLVGGKRVGESAFGQFPYITHAALK